MMINDERVKKSTVPFEQLEPGDVFEYDDEIFMRTEDFISEDYEFNCVSLEDGALYIHNLEDKVTLLVVQLRIIRNE